MGSGSSVPCCNDRESYIRDEDRDSVTVSRRNFRHHDLEIVSRTNNLLNRWNQAEVISLKVSINRRFIVQQSIIRVSSTLGCISETLPHKC